jgi:hypothetical protein
MLTRESPGLLGALARESIPRTVALPAASFRLEPSDRLAPRWRREAMDAVRAKRSTSSLGLTGSNAPRSANRVSSQPAEKGWGLPSRRFGELRVRVPVGDGRVDRMSPPIPTG